MIHVGPAGWSYADWEGRVTPRRKPRGFHGLAHLARYLGFVEVNSSFYALPSARNAERWAGLVADHPTFRFGVKLYQGFTHAADLSGDERVRAREQFLRGVEPLAVAGRLWSVLAQFPVSFRPGRASWRRLERIAEEFGVHPLVLEVRHRSWFTPEHLRRIEGLGYSLATIDLPAAPDHPPTDVPSIGPLGYHRLHGRNAGAWFDREAGRDQRYDYLYGADEVAELVQVTRRIASGSDETAVITNNHFSGKAVANALEILAALDGAPPLAPAELVEAFPHLRDVVRVDGQATLF